VNKKISILHISLNFNYSCGVSKYVFNVLENFSNKDSYQLFFITNGGDALDKLKKIGITPSIMEFSKGWKNIGNITANKKFLKDFCIKNNINIIHTHHRYPEFLSYQISKKINVRTISTVHSLVEGKNKLSFKSDKLIAVSKSVETMLRKEYNVPSNRIIMQYNCVEPLEVVDDSKIKTLKSELNITDKAKTILFLGRISLIKGTDLLVEAFNLIKKVYPDIFLLIVGQFYDEKMKHFLNNLPHEIKVINAVENPYPFYQIADLIVLPSRVESLGYVMLESGLMKKPFIGSRTGGIAEFIDDHINGLLFEPENVNQLAEKIEYLLNNPDEAKALGKNLYRKVIQNISCSRYYQKLDKIYNEIIA
jgi:glycosyltransferase involved in cell wall biosynthesis